MSVEYAATKIRQQTCIRTLRVRISARLEKEATVVWSCFWDPWIRRNRCRISRDSTYVLRDENVRKGKECLRTRNIRTCYLLTLPLLIFSLLIVTRPMTESWDSDTRRFATSFYPVALYKCFSIPARTIYLYNHRFHSPYKWCHIYQVSLISFGVILSCVLHIWRVRA